MCWNGDKGYGILYVLWAASRCSFISLFPSRPFGNVTSHLFPSKVLMLQHTEKNLTLTCLYIKTRIDQITIWKNNAKVKFKPLKTGSMSKLKFKQIKRDQWRLGVGTCKILQFYRRLPTIMFLPLSIRQQAVLWIAFPSTLSSFWKMLILLLLCYIIILLLS
jgi:hypothetical protein